MLKNLGGTSEEIAKNLDGYGIRGKRCVCLNCPLTNYLKKNGYPEAEVIYYTFRLQSFHAGKNLPHQCSQFIQDFDTGKYPCLEEKE